MKQIKVDKTIHYEGGIPAAECFEKQKSEAVGHRLIRGH